MRWYRHDRCDGLEIWGEAEREIGIARGMELRAAGVGGKNGTTEFFFFYWQNGKFKISD